MSHRIELRSGNSNCQCHCASAQPPIASRVAAKYTCYLGTYSIQYILYGLHILLAHPDTHTRLTTTV